MQYCFVCLIIGSLYLGTALCELSKECQAWGDVEAHMRKVVRIMSCNRNVECTGMNCSGTFKGEDFFGGLRVNQCEDPANIQLSIDMPQLGIKDWHKSFTHGDTFELSGNLGGKVSFVKSNKNFMIGLKLKLTGPKQSYLPQNLFGQAVETEIFHDALIPVRLCENSSYEVLRNVTSQPEAQNSSDVGPTVVEHVEKGAISTKPIGNCSIKKISCAPKEMCLQMDKSHWDGNCVCIPSYSRNENGECIYKNTFSSTEVPPDHAPSSSGNASSNSGSVLWTSISVAVCTVVLLTALVYVAIKFKVFQRLRRRLRIQVYEQVLLDQQEDGELLTDPVA